MEEKISNIELGKIGEKAGENFLLGKGFCLLERNFRCRKGEIDLLFMDGSTLVAVEVKSRKSETFGLPCEAITGKKKQHLIGSLYSYVAFKGIKNRSLRIDVLEVFLDGDNKVERINHIENAI